MILHYRGNTLKVGIETVDDLREKLKFEKQRVIEAYHPYDFFNFVITAWHLHNDWMTSDKKNRPLLFGKKTRKAPSQMKDLVSAMRDLANGSKHFHLDKKNEEKKVVTEVHEPECRDFFTYYFGAQRGVSIGDTYYSLGEFVAIVDAYFDWLFDDKLPVDGFPEELLRIITIRNKTTTHTNDTLKTES